MSEAKTCPGLPECIVEGKKCLRHQWYSNIRLSHLAQEALLGMDLLDVSDEVLEEFVASRSSGQIG